MKIEFGNMIHPIPHPFRKETVLNMLAMLTRLHEDDELIIGEKGRIILPLAVMMICSAYGLKEELDTHMMDKQ